jgi:hypothetical protein
MLRSMGAKQPDANGGNDVCRPGTVRGKSWDYMKGKKKWRWARPPKARKKTIKT